MIHHLILTLYQTIVFKINMDMGLMESVWTISNAVVYVVNIIDKVRGSNYDNIVKVC